MLKNLFSKVKLWHILAAMFFNFGGGYLLGDYDVLTSDQERCNDWCGHYSNEWFYSSRVIPQTRTCSCVWSKTWTDYKEVFNLSEIP